MTPQRSVEQSTECGTDANAAQSDAKARLSPPQVCEEMREGFKPMEKCPMAEMCKGMMNKEGAGRGWLLFLPGLLLVLVGLLVILVPGLLVWLVGITAIVMGLAAFFIASSIRKISAQSGNNEG